jgi:hypothetical protein
MPRYLPHESVPPYGLSEQLEARVRALGMQSNLSDMEKDGYTVIRDVAPLAVTDGIREAILRLVHETQGPQRGYTAALLLGRDPVFDTAVLNPKLMALVEYMCGQGALLSQLIGSVRPQGRGFLGIHADQNWFPAPFPEHNQLLTACWVCDEFSEAHGATKVIPGSQRNRRHPSPEEAAAAAGAIPIVCPRGSIAVWDGSVWHGNYPRALPGERVVLHLTYSRLALRPLESYDHLAQDFLERNPPEMATLLGRGSVFGSTTASSGGVVRSLFNRATLQAKNHYQPRPPGTPG